MATPLQVLLRGENERLLEQAALDVFHTTRTLETLWSRFLPDSEISILNNLAAREPIRVESSTFELLRRCRDYSKWSGGAFDVTVEPLLELWDVSGTGRVPSDEEIVETLKVVGMDKVLFEGPSLLAAFAAQGVRLDLGAVGKGAAIDVALKLLREKWPVAEAYLSFGRSTIGAIGTWRIQVMSPLDETKPVYGFTITDEAAGISSIGPRRFVHKVYTSDKVDHIIDPRTGRARADVVTVAAVAKSAEAADALTTALAVLGEEEARAVAKVFGAREVIFIRPRGEALVARSLDVGAGSWTENELTIPDVPPPAPRPPLGLLGPP